METRIELSLRVTMPRGQLSPVAKAVIVNCELTSARDESRRVNCSDAGPGAVHNPSSVSHRAMQALWDRRQGPSGLVAPHHVGHVPKGEGRTDADGDDEDGYGDAAQIAVAVDRLKNRVLIHVRLNL